MKEKILAKLRKYFSELIAVLVLLLTAVIGGVYIAPKVFFLGILFALIYIAILLLVKAFSRDRKDKKSELFTNVTVELLMNMKMPVAILDSEGAVVWYNQSFSDRSTEKNLYGTNINDLLEVRLNINHLKETLDGESLDASFSGIKYKVDSYRISNENNDFFITVWHDLTVEEALREKLDSINPIVSYIYVDNSVDASSNMDSEYRSVTAKISGILNEWVTSMNGILREFDRDKYIAIFDKSFLPDIIDSKFDVLDRVRKVSEDSEIAVSISIGMACLEDATFFDKEQKAHQALDLAMQRGGDQAVLRFDETSDYFGGRLKPVQKKAKTRSRITAARIASCLKNDCGNVIIMGHKYADFDSIGSCVGMASFCMMHCNNVKVVVNRNDVNISKIIEKLEKHQKYQGVFIDAVSAQDLVRHDTLLIICDVNNPAIFEAPEIYENVKNFVIIDHHRKTGDFIVEPIIENYIEPSASSASELVAEMLEQTIDPGTLLKEEADALYTGIVLDTKSFTKNTGVRTFAAAHFLRREGASPADTEEYFKTTFDDFVSEAKFENSVVVYRNHVAITMLEEDTTQADKISASRVADRLMKIDGIKAAFALCKIGNTTHISARSDGTVNVQLILEQLNGGGHFDAAGAQVSDDPMDKVLIRLRDAIDNFLDNK